MADIKENAVHQALETIRNRIDQFGVYRTRYCAAGRECRYLSSCPALRTRSGPLSLIGRTAQLEFKLVDEENAAKAASGAVPEGDELLMEKRRNRETGIVTTTPDSREKTGSADRRPPDQRKSGDRQRNRERDQGRYRI